MANCKLITLAHRRNYGRFKNFDIHVEAYNNSAKGRGGNKKMLKQIKTGALERFNKHFETFRFNLEADCWILRVGIDFGDDEND